MRGFGGIHRPTLNNPHPPPLPSKERGDPRAALNRTFAVATPFRGAVVGASRFSSNVFTRAEY